MLNKVASFARRNVRKYLNFLERGQAYWGAKLRGLTYVEHYTERMDKLFSEDKSWGLAEDRIFQLDYLRAHGLKPGSTLLDLGCGPIAAGRHMISYLDVGCYVGADISKSGLEEAARRVQRFGLTDKRPEFVCMPSGSLDSLNGRTFEFVWANSVLTHLPPEAALSLLVQVRRLMKSDSVFFATFMRGDAFQRQNFENFAYSPGEIIRLGERAGFTTSIMDDWRHPFDPKKVDTMARFTMES